MSRHWRQSAACTGSWDLFFGPEDEPARSKAGRERRAIAVCGPCPVRARCLDWHLSFPYQHGVAGGKTEEQRKAMRHALLKRQQRQERSAA